MIFRLTASTYIHMFWGKDHPHVDRHHRPISLSTALCMYRRLSHLIKVWLSLSSVDSLVFIKTNLMWWYRATESVMQCDGGGEFSSSAFSTHTHTHTGLMMIQHANHQPRCGWNTKTAINHTQLIILLKRCYRWNSLTYWQFKREKNLYRNHIRTNVN